MTEDHTGERFDLEVRHGVALGLSKATDLILREFDVGEVAGRDFGHGRFDLGLAQSETSWIVVIEFDGQPAHGGISASRNVGQCRFDDPAHLRIVLGAFGFGFSRLQMSSGHDIVSFR